jgi:ATP-dependent DNA helicase RecG
MDRPLGFLARVWLFRPRSLKCINAHAASQILRRLRDRGLLELHPAGSQSYYTLTPKLRLGGVADRGEQALDRGELRSDRGEQVADRGEQLDPSLVQAIAGLGSRPRKERLRAVMTQICANHWRSPSWLGNQLRIDPSKLTERHLGPMVKQGLLERRYPDQPTHAEQAYRAALSQGNLPFLPSG